MLATTPLNLEVGTGEEVDALALRPKQSEPGETFVAVLPLPHGCPKRARSIRVRARRREPCQRVYVDPRAVYIDPLAKHTQHTEIAGFARAAAVNSTSALARRARH
jgi:hypothetical protein